jgi:hypothetical protein
MVFKVQLVITERGLVPPDKLDYPITFKIPVYNTTLQVDEVLQVSNCNTGILDYDTCISKSNLKCLVVFATSLLSVPSTFIQKYVIPLISAICRF